MKPLESVEINLDYIKPGLRLFIDSRRPNTLFDGEESAIDNNEARYQLVEGCYYDFQINDSKYCLGDIGQNIIQKHKRNSNIGTISPNIYTGTLEIPILKNDSTEIITPIQLEVQSAKTGYRDDYRDMLQFITEKSTDLLLHVDSPVSQYFRIDPSCNSESLYQRFSFIKSVLNSEEFTQSIHKIITAPVTRWKEISESKDIRNIRKLSNDDLKEILQKSNRIGLPKSHHLRTYGIESIPSRIRTDRKSDSLDTPENRLIKHALETFLQYCTDINGIAKQYSYTKLGAESDRLIIDLENILQHSFFNHISKPTTLKLNSPVLQRKEGYREILRVWLMFELAAKLIWQGGDDIYSAGKKDIATLYEYWIFFKLLELIENIFQIEAKDISELIKPTPDGLNLQLKQGKFTALRGVYNNVGRKTNIRFSYNRSFTGKKRYPESGSWTTTLRPDFTLSLWPHGISEEESEKQELIVHIHFDAKYKVSNLFEIIDNSDIEILNNEKFENRKGIYKNADLLKMHAYKDAIRRTGGAYVLYPGDTTIYKKGFHEIIPGLGAFTIKPSKNESGIGELKSFILEIIEHFLNRTSQREKIAYRTFDIFKDPPNSADLLMELLPEPIGKNRNLIPDETYVLVGYYNSKEKYSWIKRNGLYNFRMGTGPGSLVLDKETVSAQYLLLHTAGDNGSGNLWKIVSRGPRAYSKEDLKRMGYPSPSQDNYLVIQIEEVKDPEFSNIKWNFRKLKNYSAGRAAAFPFTATLSELMKNKM